MKNTREFHNTNMKKLAPANQLGQFLPVTATSSPTTRTTLPYSSCSNLLGLDNMNDPTVEQLSSRWNPTAEQLLALEEMYRRGIRTPSADQIQQIASQLRRFGKIEGKNVFYWFQNHKARERQKRRREADFTSAATTLKLHAGFREEDYSHSGSFQPQQKKTISVSSNCTEFLEGAFPLQKAESTATNTSNNGWPQKKNYTWHNLNNTTATSSSTSLKVEETQMMLKPRRNNDLEPEEFQIETLELFPVHGISNSRSNSEDNKARIGTGRRKKLTRPFNTNQYIEFLKENRN